MAEEAIFNDFGRVIEVYFDSSFGSFYEFVKLYESNDPREANLLLSDYVIDGSLTPFAKENGLLDPPNKIVDHLSSLDSERNSGIWTVAR